MAFTRRDLFWYSAGVMTVAVIALLVHALSGTQNSSEASLSMHGAAAPAPPPPDASATNPGPADENAPTAPASPRAAGSMEEMLARLEGRLAAQGGSDSDWELLAQTYDFVGRTDDAKLARAHQLPPSAMTTASPSVSPANESAAANGPATISGHVDLAGALKSRVPDGLTLFIVAKSVDSPGPPVAILRTTTGQWPLAFTLSDSNAMMPGRSLSTTRRVTIEARVSRSGGAAPQPGDFQSSVTTLDAHPNAPVRIVIDHVIS